MRQHGARLFHLPSFDQIHHRGGSTLFAEFFTQEFTMHPHDLIFPIRLTARYMAS